VTTTLLGPLPDATRAAVSQATSWVFLLCIVPLLWSTVRYPYQHDKRAHPKPVMWATWFLVGSMATIGQALGGAPIESWRAKLFLSAGPAIVAIVALLWHEPLVITWVDRWSLWLCVAGVAVYVPLFFGWIGPADPVAAGVVVVVVAMVVDLTASAGQIYSVVREREPVTQIVTFGLALAAVLAVLCILPWPWTFLSAAIFVFLAVQQVCIIAALAVGRARHPRGTPEAAAASA
jgi:hypothetical protein